MMSFGDVHPKAVNAASETPPLYILGYSTLSMQSQAYLPLLSSVGPPGWLVMIMMAPWQVTLNNIHMLTRYNMSSSTMPYRDYCVLDWGVLGVCVSERSGTKAEACSRNRDHADQVYSPPHTLPRISYRTQEFRPGVHSRTGHGGSPG